MSGEATGTTLDTLQRLAELRVLGSLLDHVRRDWGGYDLLLHHQQGEFHHDVFVRVPNAKPRLPGEYLVISTNCNGGVKEVLCFEQPAEPAAPILAVARTEHWFDPCELLGPDARSELKAAFRERQPGGGWCKKPDL